MLVVGDRVLLQEVEHNLEKGEVGSGEEYSMLDLRKGNFPRHLQKDGGQEEWLVGDSLVGDSLEGVSQGEEY